MLLLGHPTTDDVLVQKKKKTNKSSRLLSGHPWLRICYFFFFQGFDSMVVWYLVCFSLIFISTDYLFEDDKKIRNLRIASSLEFAYPSHCHLSSPSFFFLLFFGDNIWPHVGSFFKRHAKCVAWETKSANPAVMCGSSAGQSCCANAVEGDVDDTPDVQDSRPGLTTHSRWAALDLPFRPGVSTAIISAPFQSSSWVVRASLL